MPPQNDPFSRGDLGETPRFLNHPYPVDMWNDFAEQDVVLLHNLL